MTDTTKTTVDGFENIEKGLGTEKDPRTYTRYIRPLRINYQQANDLYTYNWLAAKVVDTPIDDATRKWRQLLIDDEDKREKIEDVFDFFNVKEKTNLALKWSRVFGGSVIIMVINNEDMATPLNINTISKGALSNLIVLDRYNVYAGVVDRDILSPNFGKPEYYTVTRDGALIHHSRIIKFQGYVPSIYQWELENYWGLSIFNRVWKPIEDSQVVSDLIATSVWESNIDVYKINDLNSMVANQQDSLVIKRLQIAHRLKSVINGIAIDKNDDYDKKSNKFASLPEIDDRFIQKVSGASNIPVTRLIGISPAGQNATGESDMLNYYDFVRGIQEGIIRPQLDILDSVVMASEFGTGEKLDYKFLPLKELTEIEQATVDLNNANRDQVYDTLDVITKIDILSNLASKGTYVSIDANRVEEEEKEFDLLDDPFGETELEEEGIVEV